MSSSPAEIAHLETGHESANPLEIYFELDDAQVKHRRDVEWVHLIAPFADHLQPKFQIGILFCNGGGYLPMR